MNPSFTLVFVGGDGSRVVRLTVPRWIAYGALGLGVAAASSIALLSGHYALLRHRSGDMVALSERIDDQRLAMESFQKRVGAIRTDLLGWKVVHARMWEAFGPEVTFPPDQAGIGGGVPVQEPAAANAADELALLANDVAEEGPRLHELESLVTRTGRILDGLPLRWPVRGAVKSEFGRRRSPWDGKLEQHDGIDIGSPTGTPIMSPATGQVVAASSFGDFGKHVLIDHGNGVRSLYGHMKRMDVRSGEQVEKGQVLGLVGSTGKSTGPHLHYELMVEGKSVDPRSFLWVQ